MTLADRIVVLQAGRIEQVGSPMELYQHPDNLFVAGFIGSPRMNFLAGELAEAGPDGAAVRLKSGDLVQTSAQTGAADLGAPVTLGVRPEHFQLGAADNGLTVTVRFVESLGNTTFAYGGVPGAGQEITCELPGDTRVQAGDELRVGVPATQAHVFDAEGRALPRTGAAPRKEAA